MQEFDLIDRYFKPLGQKMPSVVLGIGDDAALLRLPANETLAITTDTLIEGVHFPVGTSPEDMAYKAIMVNASDLAAMGATPRWFLVAITAPTLGAAWLETFTSGLQDALSALNSTLIGGDTTRGTVFSLTVQALGTLTGDPLLRSAAKIGDRIGVTGPLGAAAFALTKEGQLNATAQAALNRPRARLDCATILKTTASSAIDISDGIAQDLQHILEASGVGAEVFLKDLPLASCLQNMPRENALNLALSGGDDYELLFTVAPEKVPSLKQQMASKGLAFYEIGEITAEKGLHFFEADGSSFTLKKLGYQHF